MEMKTYVIAGIVTIWDVVHNRLVFRQSNSVVKAAEGGGVAVTRLLYREPLKTLAVVSVDHNIILHHAVTFAITRQVRGRTTNIVNLLKQSFDILGTKICLKVLYFFIADDINRLKKNNPTNTITQHNAYIKNNTVIW